jgi:hypothetical protein
MQTHRQNTTDSRSSKMQSSQQSEAHLAFNLTIYDDENDGEAGQQPVSLMGYTQSVGNDALTLVGPFYHFGYRYLMGRDRTLQIVLDLPTGPVHIQGFPARYTKITDDNLSDGYMLTGPNLTSFGETDVNCLIEVSILVMSNSDRAKYTQYLRQIGAQEEVIEFKVLPPMMEPPPQKSRAALYVAAS